MTVRQAMAILESVCRTVSTWAQRQPEVLGLALVGSWARNAAHADSDIDLVVLVTDPHKFRGASDWLQEIAWPAPVAKWMDVSYGSLWSRHCELQDRTKVELGFTSREWASRSPLDPGTTRVVRDGCKILYDPVCLLEQLCRHVAQQGAPADAAERRG